MPPFNKSFLLLSQPARTVLKCRGLEASLRIGNLIRTMKNFNALSEREVLALAISLEEEDERVYADFFEGLRQEFPASATVFDSMRKEESGHRRRLIELFQRKFGEHIPLIRRQDVKGFVQRTPVWLVRPLGLDTVRKQASAIEVETEPSISPARPGCTICSTNSRRRALSSSSFTPGRSFSSVSSWARSSCERSS